MNSGKDRLRACEILYEQGFYKDANNRAYYSIFNSLRAVLSLEPIDFKSHKSVIAYFNQHYFKTEIFPRELGHRVSLANAVREDSDYLDSYMMNRNETKEQIETAKEVSKCAEKYIINWIKNNPNFTQEEKDRLLKTINR